MKNAFRFAALAGIVLSTVHCSDGARLAPSTSASSTGTKIPATNPSPLVPTPTRVALATFTATVDHQANTIHFARVSDGASAGSKLTPDSLNSVSDPSGVNGNPASGTVDLVSTNCQDGEEASPVTPTFQCDVQLISGFTRDLPNVYVQVSNAVLSGSSTTLYDATNSDPELNTTNDGVLTQSHGLWNYSNASVKAKAAWPFIGSKASGNNKATVTWKFANPADQNVVYTIVVWSTEYWAKYNAFGGSDGSGKYGNEGYTDACGGTGTAFTSGNVNTVTLPFDFTLFNNNSTSLNICEVGGFTLGSTGSWPCPSNFVTPASLPTNTITDPIFFAFWDELTFGVAGNDQSPTDNTKKKGRVCYKTLSGTSAPNQIGVVEWRNMDFRTGDDVGSSLDFEAFIYEGTGEIDLYYYAMGNATGDTTHRANCSDSNAKCFIGVQGRDQTGNGSSSNTSLVGFGELEIGGLDSPFASPSAFTFIPAP